jgi:hypothetical protein
VSQGASTTACAGAALKGKAHANIRAAKIFRSFNADSLLRATYKVYPKKE